MNAPTKTQKDVSKNFVPIPDLENMAVGHAGLYPVDQEIDETISSSDAIEPIINIGTGKGEKILLDIEPGVRSFIKDALSKKLDSVLEKYGLSKDMERVKAIPNSMTGVLIYYLTKGIERDFGITWVNSPVSIREKETKLEKDKAKGRIGLSKKEKNELLAKRNYPYWQKDIDEGKITFEEAVAYMKAADDKVKEYEDAGYFLSPNKTKGVALFDWKSSVIEAHGNNTATKIYTRNKVEVVIPDLVENYYCSPNKPKKLAKDLEKTFLSFTKGVGDILGYGKNDNDNGGMELKEISSTADLYELIKDSPRFSSTIQEIDADFNIKGFHLAKLMQSGMMKPRHICIDCVSKKDGKQHLYLLDKEGGVHHFQ